MDIIVAVVVAVVVIAVVVVAVVVIAVLSSSMWRALVVPEVGRPQAGGAMESLLAASSWAVFLQIELIPI